MNNAMPPLPALTIRTIFLLGILSLLGCKGQDTEAKARHICACLAPLEAPNAALSDVLRGEDADQVLDVLARISAAAGQAEACLRSREIQGPVHDPALIAALDRACPGWGAAFASLSWVEE